MINKSGQIATPGGVNNGLMIEPKHVNTRYTTGVVAFLAMIGDRLSNDLTHILDDKLLGSDRLHCEQPPAMNIRFGELERFFSEFELSKLEDFMNMVIRGHEPPLE